jgi:putative chitobiose transport system permease protein
MATNRLHTSLWVWGLMALPVLLLCALFVWPAVMAVVYSLHNYQNSLWQAPFYGLGNYARLWQSEGFWQSLWVTLLFTAVTLPAMVLLPIPLAVGLHRTGHPLYRLLAYVPVVSPLVAVSIVWKGLYQGDGLFNQALRGLGLPVVGWLTHPSVALWAIVAMVVWKGLAYYGMMYLTHLQQMDPQWEEAALLDGANAWQRFWWLTMPAVKPAMGVVGLICLLGCFKAFTEFYVMTRGGPMGSTTTWLYWIYSNGFERLDLGLASAGGLVLMAVLGLLAWVQQRWLAPKPD